MNDLHSYGLKNENLKTEAKRYRPTIFACFFGYITQSIVVTFAPLLFLTFESSYGIPLSQITLLISVNFALQLLIDLSAVFFIDKIGYRACSIAANVFAACGLISLAILPEFLPPFSGLLISVVFYGIGGGLLEVVISPMVEACPNDKKEQTMSLLHSFYCWGCLAVSLLSTAFFALFGTKNWHILSILWAIVPSIDAILFIFVPIKTLNEGSEPIKPKKLFKNSKFWLYALIILCSGASEQAVSQWASSIAEKKLNGNKALGDLLGPSVFAAAMGLSRLLYGKSNGKRNLETLMLISGAGCILSYALIVISPSAVVAFAAMGLCGFSVGILWPGSLSSASTNVNGGNAMFALLALFGDLGCMSGPSLAGLVSGAFNNDLKSGICAAAIFPLTLIVCLIFAKKSAKNDNRKSDNEQLKAPVKK